MTREGIISHKYKELSIREKEVEAERADIVNK
jgi:hypothetical protein